MPTLVIGPDVLAFKIMEALLLLVSFVVGCTVGARASLQLDATQHRLCLIESSLLTGVLYCLVAHLPVPGLVTLLLAWLVYRHYYSLGWPHMQVSQQEYDMSIGYHLVVNK